MLTPTPKFFLTRPIFGLPPVYALGGVALCLVLGIMAAMTLDRMSRGDGVAGIAEGADARLPAPVFAEPETGIIRTVVADDSPAWMRNAAAFPAGDRAPRLAIIVVDEGAGAGPARSALKLPAPVSVAIAPTADSAAKTALAARSAGREVLLLLPMQSEEQFDTSPNPIAINILRTELVRRMNWNMAQFEGYVGVMNRFGENATRDSQTMRAVLEVVKAEGLAFVDARETPSSIAGAVARRMNVPAGDRTIAVARGADAAELGASLANAVRHAERWGAAIITIPAERRMVTALADWLARPVSGVKIAPVSAVIQRLRSGAIKP